MCGKEDIPGYFQFRRLQMVMRRCQTGKRGLQSRQKRMYRYSRNIKLELFFHLLNCKENRKIQNGIYTDLKERAKVSPSIFWASGLAGNFNHIYLKVKSEEARRQLHVRSVVGLNSEVLILTPYMYIN